MAHRLRADGLAPEGRVALLMDRSAALVVAQLAVLKAGGAYVPVDGRAPEERRRTLLDQAGVTARLTAEEVRAARTADPAGAPALPPADPDRLAYVMFTSGSTGTPKAVGVRHRDVAALATDSRFTGPACERVLLHSPVAFDAATFEVWAPLLNGGRVVVAPPGAVDAALLRRSAGGGEVTALWLTAGLFRLLAQDAPDCFAGLRQVWTGGDVVPAAAVRRVLAACPGLTVVDGYGPTETTTFATSFAMTDAAAVPGTVPIGHPLDDMRVHVLDARMRPVPPGVAGELFLAGEGVARGYLGRPGATADRFVADPSGPPGARMYRTGDLARRRLDGTVEFLGRTDDQVKIRGFRVEPGEVEAALAAHPGVADVAVVARAERSGTKRLVAYVVGHDGLDTEALRTHARDTLPDYLVPTAFVALAALPLSANGKVDRAALPAPGTGADRPEPVAPRTEAERRTAEVWAEVLGVERVGVQDDFFALGGDSILSIRLTSRLAEAFGTDLTPRAVFTHPTPAALAALLTQPETAPAGRGAIVPAPRDTAPPLSFAQQRLWFLDEFAPGSSEYITPLALRLHGRLDIAALGAALTALVARHESLRTTFDSEDGQGIQVIHPPQDVPLPLHDLSALPADDRAAQLARLLSDDRTRPFDLRQGPLLRAGLIRLADDDHVLTLTLHHIITDGWSTGVLTGDLAHLYRAALGATTAELPALPVQYADCRALAAHRTRCGRRGATALLAGTPGRNRAPGAAHRPAAPGRTDQERGNRPARPPAGDRPHAGGVRPGPADHPVHDAGRRRADPLRPAVRTAGRRRRNRHLGPRPRRDPAPDRVLRQHAGAALGRRPGPGLPGIPGAGAGDGPGRLRAPGRAVRAGGGRGPAPPRHQPHPALPGHGRAAERARSGAGPARSPGERHRAGHPPRRLRRHPGVRRDRLRRAARADHLQHRPVRHRHRRADGRPAHHTADRYRRRPAPPPRRAAPRPGRRTAAAAGPRVRHPGRGAPGHPARAVPAAGGPDARRRGTRRRRTRADLRGAGARGQPAGAPPHRPRRGPRAGGGAGAAPLGGVGGGTAGRGQGRRRLPARGPGLPGRAAGLHGARLRGHRGPRRPRRHLAYRRPRLGAHRHGPHRPADGRAPRLRHLHLRIDRHPQGQWWSPTPVLQASPRRPPPGTRCARATGSSSSPHPASTPPSWSCACRCSPEPRWSRARRARCSANGSPRCSPSGGSPTR